MSESEESASRELHPYQMFNLGGVNQNFSMTVEKVLPSETVTESVKEISPEAEPMPTPSTPKPPTGAAAKRAAKVEEKEFSPEDFELSIDEPSA